MPFNNSTQIDPVTIPETAGPNEARIVIGSILPPPLDTFLVTTIAGDALYSGGIVLYGDGDDTTYQYIAIVPEPAVSDRFAVHWGVVLNGAVLEENNGLSGGYPQALKMRLASGPDMYFETTTENVSLLADQGVTISSRNNSISLSAINGAVISQGNQFTFENFQISGAHDYEQMNQLTTGGTTSSGSFANYPDLPAVTVFKTMHSGLTDIMVRFDPSFYTSDGATGPEFAVRVDGTTDVVTRRYPGTIPAVQHLIAPGMARITGLGEGNHTFQPRWRRVSGAGTLSADTNDGGYIHAWEVSAL